MKVNQMNRQRIILFFRDRLMLIISFLLLVMTLLYPFSNLASSSKLSTFTVYNFNNQSEIEDWDWLERGLPDMLEQTFLQNERVQYVPLSTTIGLPQEEFAGISKYKDTHLFHSLNNFLNVDNIFTANYFLDQQGKVHLNLVMYQSNNDELYEFRELVESSENIFKLKEDIAMMILEEVDITVDKELETSLKTNISTSISALKAYYQAIELRNQAIHEYQGIDFPSKPLWSKAIEYGEKAVLEDPHFSEAYYLLAEIYERTKWTIREASNLEKYIEAAENHPNIKVSYERLSNALYRLAYSKYNQGDKTAAIHHLEDSISYNPNHIEARTYLMNIYYETGQVAKALQQSEEIERILPDKQGLEWLSRKTQQSAKYGKEAYESYERGYHTYISKNYPEAIQLLERAVNLSEDFKEAHYYLALSYYHYGNLDAAINHWEEAIRLDPFDNNARIYLNKANEEKKYGREVVWLFNQGYKHYIFGEYDEALNIFKSAIHMNPEFEKVRMYLMRTYYHLNQMDKYLEERRKIGESESFADDGGREYYLLAFDFFSLGEYDIALENLKEALKMNPDFPEARFLIAETFYQINDFDEALFHYQYIVDNFKESEYYDNSLLGGGWCAYLLENYLLSEEYLELLVAQFPKGTLYQDGMYKLGRVYFIQEKYQDTINIYEKLNSLESLAYDALEIQFILGQSYFWMDEYEKSKSLMKDLIDSYPDFILIDEARYFYSFSLFKEGKYQESAKNLEEISTDEKSKVWEESLYLLGRSLIELKEYDRVIAINQKLLEKNLNDDILERVLFDLGLSYSRKGKNEESILYLRRVIQEYPYGELAGISHIELAQSYYDLGQYQDALSTLEEIDSKEALEIKIDSAVALNDDALLLSLYQELGERYPEDSLTADGHYSLAKSQFDKGEYQKAIDTFKQLENMESSEEMIKESNYWQGLSYYRLGEYQLANEYFGKIDHSMLTEDEVTIRSLYMLAETYYQQKDFLQAIPIYEKFLENYRAHSLAEHAHYSLGWAYLNHSDYQRALQIFNLFIQEYPDSQFFEESLFLMGKIYFLSADRDKSQKQLIDFIDQYPDNLYREESLYIIAQIDLENQKWIDSIIYFEKLIDEYPDSQFLPGSLYGLCLSYFKKEEYSKAISAGEEYLLLYSSGSFACDVLYITAICYEELGSIDEARVKYEQIVSDCPNSIYFEGALKQLDIIASSSE